MGVGTGRESQLGMVAEARIVVMGVLSIILCTVKGLGFKVGGLGFRVLGFRV